MRSNVFVVGLSLSLGALAQTQPVETTRSWGVQGGIGRAFPTGEVSRHLADAPFIRASLFMELDRLHIEALISDNAPAILQPFDEPVQLGSQDDLYVTSVQAAFGYNLLNARSRCAIIPGVAVGMGTFTRMQPNFARTSMGRIPMVTAQMQFRCVVFAARLQEHVELRIPLELNVGYSMRCYERILGVRGDMLLTTVAIGWLRRSTQ